MKKLSHSVIAATLAVIGANGVQADQTSHVYGLYDRSSNHVAFTHATVIVEPGKSIKNATLVIDNGRIISVKANGKIPAGAQEIDLSSHIVYPGFIDPYSNYVFGKTKPKPHDRNKGPQYTGKRKGGNAWNNAIHAEVDWVNEFKADQKSAKTYIENGFTAVQTGKLDGIFQGQATTVSLSSGLPNDLIYNANARHFGSFDKGSSEQQYPSSLMGSIALIRQSLSDANWYQKASAKTDHLLTGEPIEYNAALANLSELKTTGIIFNADDNLSTLRADKLFDEYKITASFVADGHEYARINQIKQTQATFIVPVNYPTKPDVSSFETQLDVSLAELRHWERAPANAAVLAKNNIAFAFTHQGLKKPADFWKQIKTSIKHGLSEEAALAALTTTPARLAGISKSAGKIEAGMYADLVIADANIFQDGKIKSVWLQGKETSLTPILPVAYTGNYKMKIADINLTLSLTEKENKVSGEFKIDDKKAKIKVHNQHHNQIQFSADLTELGLAGTYLVSGRLNAKLLSGFYVDNKAQRKAFKSIATTLQTPESPADAIVDEPLSFVSQITLPNRAFGLTETVKQQNVHVKNITVWTSEEAGILVNHDVLVRKGKIYKIAKNLKTPKGYLTIDGTGKHLTAGIVDEHSHIAISKGVNEGSDAITAEVKIGDVVNPDDINIYRALAGGTTSAQLLHGSANPVGGQAQVIKLRWGTDAETMKNKKAPGSIKFALGENVKQSNWGDKFTIRYPQTRMGVETIVRDAFNRAKEYQATWEQYDDLSSRNKKITSPPRRDFRLDTLVEIMQSKRFVHSHSYVASEILSLMNIAEDFNFKIQTFTHILEGYKVADEMFKHGASASTFSDWWAYKFEVVDAIPMNTCLMMDRGVNVSINSDSGDLIRRLNTEAAKSVQHCGMTQQDAIKMITINPAKQLKIDDHTGSISKGKDADFVIWSDNPLSIYAKVEQTWIDGRNYFSRSKDAEMRLAVAEEKNRLIQKLLAATDKKANKTDHDKSTGKSESNKASKNNPSADVYILKDMAQWQCDDNFDYWQWRSTQQTEQSSQSMQSLGEQH